MNYNKIYDSIIDRAKNRSLDTYTETHHIIPRCMGGSDDETNLVKLTYREHFIAHWLLHRIYPNNRKIAFAFTAMTMGRFKRRLVDTQWTPSSRQLEELKLARLSARRGKPHSKETKMKIRNSHMSSDKKRAYLERIRETPRTLTDTTKERMSESAVNKWRNPTKKVADGIESMKQKKTGVKRGRMSDEMKDKISKSQRSRNELLKTKSRESIYKEIVELYTIGTPILQIQKITSVSRPTINKVLKDHNCKKL